jgi:hypothetical protein
MECENVARWSKELNSGIADVAESQTRESLRKASAALDEADRLYEELKEQ